MIFWRGAWINRDAFEARISKLSAFLQSVGVVTGERVAILAQNHPIHLEGIEAARRFGWIHAPLNYRLPPLELAPLVAYIAPKVLIYGAEFEAQALEAKRQSQEVQLFRLEDIERLDGLESPSQQPSRPEDTIMLLFTGGTTGTPKAAQITRAMFETNIADTIAAWQLSRQDCTVVATPMFHAGVNALATPLLELGGRVAILEKFTPEGYLEMVRDSEATLLFAVPTMFQMLIESAAFTNFDFSSIKYAITGGSPCPSRVRNAFAAKGVQFKLGYGMTEAGVNCFTQNLELAQLKPNSVGFPMPNLKARLHNENGAEANSGELMLSGKQIMAGYWQKPLETAQVLRLIDGEMWLLTGDLATRDADGDYSIIGRSKEMIISGGENIYPLEIERAIDEHPSVLECAVLGVPDAQWGEVALAVVVTRVAISLENLREFLRQRLANYKIPKHYVFMAELPKSAAGKILKSVLRKDFIKARELVLLHGNYASGRWWQDFFGYFAPTLPGFAATPALEQTSIATLCDWLEQKMAHLKKPVLLGHSLGGVLALELAARHPQKYAALILVSSPSLTGFVHNPAGDAIRAQLPHNRALLEQIFKLQSPSLREHSGERWEGILDDAQSLPFEIGNGLAIELGRWNRLESADVLAQLPTLILGGQADMLVTPDITQRLAAQLPQAHLELREGVGHWLPLEQPEWFQARVQAFLEAL